MSPAKPDNKRIKKTVKKPTAAPAVGIVNSRRVQAMEDRRRRIVATAATLIATREDGGFTMSELARHSDLSLATPYNLFGSKAGVLGAVFERQIRSFQEAGIEIEGATVGLRLIAAVDRLVSAFGDNPQFFRNLWRALITLSPTEHKELIVPVSSQLLLPWVESLIAGELISKEVGASAIATTMVRIFDANFEQWAGQDWEADQLRAALLSGFALCLLGLVPSQSRAELLKLID